jgi:hypothetical protein
MAVGMKARRQGGGRKPRRDKQGRASVSPPPVTPPLPLADGGAEEATGSATQKVDAAPGEAVDDAAAASPAAALSVASADAAFEIDLLRLLVKTCVALFHVGKKDCALSLLSALYYTERFHNHTSLVRMVLVDLATLHRTPDVHHLLLRQLIAEHPSSPVLWVLFSRMHKQMHQLHMNRKYLLRQFMLHPGILLLMVLTGNEHFTHSAYSSAVAHYVAALLQQPEDKMWDPFLCLMVGLCYLLRVMGKNTANRHECALRAFSFLFQYAKLRNV